MARVNNTAQGQAIVLIALIMLVLLGFVGLAVDGGALFLLQRNARNAADASVLAATYELCKEGDPALANEADVQAAAEAAADDNHFNNDGTTNTVTMQHPPADGEIADSLAGQPSSVQNEYVQVVIWADTPTYLIHLVYPGPVEVTARAVGHCRVPRPAFAGYALVGLATASNVTGISAGGGGTITIVGAGAMSNATNSTASIQGGGGSLFTTDGSLIEAAGGIKVDGGAVIEPTAPTPVDPLPDPLATLPEPPAPTPCNPQIRLEPHEASRYFPPGCYAGLVLNNAAKEIILGDGIYYFTNDVNVQNGNLTATNVMIFMKDGGFSMTGGALTLTAMDAATNPDWAGMVFYSSRDNTSSSEAVKFTGDGKLTLTGTVYAPGVDVELAGKAGDDVTGQVIGYTVSVTGQGDFYINYDEDELYHIPPQIVLVH